MAPVSQVLEPPANPARFILPQHHKACVDDCRFGVNFSAAINRIVSCWRANNASAARPFFVSMFANREGVSSSSTEVCLVLGQLPVD